MLLTPKDPDWEARVRSSFARQPFMATLGARMTHLAPGAVDLEIELRDDLTQQHGYFHAGATSSIADSAAGYAALSLFPAGSGVLTSEYKINLLNPAKAPTLVARGRVIKPGRTLTIARGDVYGLEENGQVHVATGLFTLMCLEGLND
ncbi:PaaI family thioesterase [Roseibium sp.]|uniref:PaaI family thioesterase n=1 Tax=Roseibium sp. TaxID=1936156 RepID=UPI003A9845CB